MVSVNHKDCQVSDIVGVGTCNSSCFLSLHTSYNESLSLTF